MKEIQVFLRGGLGNQLFQYSSGLYLSQKLNKKLVLRTDLLPPSEDTIGGVSRWPNQLESFRHSGEVRSIRHQPTGKTNAFGKAMQAMRILGDLSPSVTGKLGWVAGEKSSPAPEAYSGVKLINSYSQRKDLAWSNRDQLTIELNNILHPSGAFASLMVEIEKQPTVVFHLRQGDYVGLSEIFGASSLTYYEAALERTNQLSAGNRIWLFSDSPETIDKSILHLIRPDLTIGPGALSSPIENLVLMSKGSAMVAANSTFSWWSCLISKPGRPTVVPNLIRASVNNFEIGREPNKSWEFLSA